MTDKIGLGQILNFNKGLESVSIEARTFREDSRKLPDLSYVAPSETPAMEQLGELWGQPSLGQGLVESLRPEISDRSLLIPSRYQALLQDSEDALRSLADNGDPGGKLQDAIGVLSEEREMRSLLNTYRASLFQA
jgi:hypothetical protein